MARSRTCRNHPAWLMVAVFAASLSFGGCETADQQRVKQYNQDGLHLFGQGNYPSARDSFALALELQPDDPALLFNLGQCHDRLGDWTKAEQCYYRCLERAANHGDCRHALAALQYRTARKPDAVRMIQEWLAQQPQLADPYALDGWRLRQDDAWPQARDRFHQALALDPFNVRANVELGIYYEQTNYLERARLCYERALAKNPHQPEVSERLQALKAKKVGKPLPD